MIHTLTSLLQVQELTQPRTPQPNNKPKKVKATRSSKKKKKVETESLKSYKSKKLAASKSRVRIKLTRIDEVNGSVTSRKMKTERNVKVELEEPNNVEENTNPGVLAVNQRNGAILILNDLHEIGIL